MSQQHGEEFINLLTASQRRIHAFVCTLVVDLTDADEVLQETNLALWQQADRFEPGTDFVAWACRVAYYKVLKQRDAAKRHRVKLDDAVMDLLATETIERGREQARAAAETFERRRIAVWACVDQLPTRYREALEARYGEGRSLGAIAVTLGRSANAVAQLFHRIRAMLRECVERKLGTVPEAT